MIGLRILLEENLSQFSNSSKRNNEVCLCVNVCVCDKHMCIFSVFCATYDIDLQSLCVEVIAMVTDPLREGCHYSKTNLSNKAPKHPSTFADGGIFCYMLRFPKTIFHKP